MKNIPSKCPVPIDQKPLNEYNTLKESLDFGWTRKNFVNFKQILLLIVFAALIFWSVIFITISSNELYLFKMVILTCICSSVSTALILIRYYLGWNYIYSRLMQATIAYEESGWYDGQIWIKSPETLLQDRLIGTYELQPILDRLKKTILLFLSLSLIGLIIFKFILK